MSEVEQLIEEIQQITAQYKREVDGQRKQWPRAIKERVLRLKNLGMKFKEIESRTGVSYHTIASWSAPKKFHQLPVVLERKTRNEVATVAVAKNPEVAHKKIVTVMVTTPDGFVVKLQSIRHTIDLLKGLKEKR